MEPLTSYRYPPTELVAFGQPWPELLAAEIERLSAGRVFVLASASVARATDLERRMRDVLGYRFAGFATGVRAHTPREDVLTVAAKVRDVGADVIVCVGGSSVSDAAKVVVHCLANAIADYEGFDRLPKTPAQGVLPSSYPVRIVAIPTTLSGGEFTQSGGSVDTARAAKDTYAHPDLAPRTIILDPAITVHTPLDLWLSTGMRGFDHAVESFCSPYAHPFTQAAGIHAVKLLSRSLRANRADPGNLDARLDSMMGIWLSLVGFQAGVLHGASHAISYVLGAVANVPHGHTSCVLLAPTLEWNAAANADRQAELSAAMGRPDRSAAQLVRELVIELGQPATLRDVGVRRDQLDLIAEKCFAAPWVHHNPRKVSGADDVRAILDLAW